MQAVIDEPSQEHADSSNMAFNDQNSSLAKLKPSLSKDSEIHSAGAVETHEGHSNGASSTNKRPYSEISHGDEDRDSFSSSELLCKATNVNSNETGFSQDAKKDTSVINVGKTEIIKDLGQLVREYREKGCSPLESLYSAGQKIDGEKPAYSFAYKCALVLSDVTIAEAMTPGKKKSRSSVIERAVELLTNPHLEVVSDESGNLTVRLNPMADKQNPVQQSSSVGVNSSVSSSVDVNSSVSSSVDVNSSISSSVGVNSSVLSSQQSPLLNHNVSLKTNALSKPTQTKNKKKKKKKKAANLQKVFFIFDKTATSRHPLTPFDILLQSTQYCKVPFQNKCMTVNSGAQRLHRCVLLLDSKFISEAIGRTKQDAKQEASLIALDRLRTTTYTIRVKSEREDGIFISPQQIAEAGSPGSLTESNIGCKMLKMMGWSGGGIGKEGNAGIVEPINADTSHKQGRGLGYSNPKVKNKLEEQKKDFVQKVEYLIKDYANSDTLSDLVFSTFFTKEERGKIMNIAMKYELKGSKVGQGPNLHIVLSKRILAHDLFNRLLEDSGSSNKYELIPPMSPCF